MATDPLVPTRPRPTPRRRRGRGLTHVALWLVFALLLVVLLLGVAALTLADRRLSLPDRLTERIERRMNAALSGGQVGLGRIDILVSRRGVPRLSAHDVELRDRFGVGIARLGDVSASFDPVRLVQGELAVRRMRLSGAEVTLRRSVDGSFALSFGQGVRSYPGLSGLLDAMDAVFAAPPFDTTERIVAEDLTVVIEDARSSRVWQIFGGRLRLERAEPGLRMTFWAEIFNGTDDLAQAEFSLSTDAGSSAAVVSARFAEVPAPDIALQSPALAFLSAIDAPISGELSATLTASGEPGALDGRLDLGAGRVQPTPAADPLEFDGALAVFAYDAAKAKITFSELSANGDLLRLSASGQTYLREIGPDGWPAALVSQFRISDAEILARDLFPGRVAFEAGAIDLRFRPDPFRIEIGQAVLMPKVAVPAEHLRARGTVSADETGWSVALDLEADEVPVSRVTELWPLPVAPRTRGWVAERVSAGTLRGLSAGLRLTPGERPKLATTFNFEGGVAKLLRGVPPATGLKGYLAILDKRMTVALEGGRLQPAEGGAIRLAGSTLVVPDRTQKPATGQFVVESESSLDAVLSYLTYPPVSLFAETGPPRIGEARARLTTRFELPFGQRLSPGEVSYVVSGRLTGLVSDTLVPGRRLTASNLTVEATPAALLVEGAALLDGVPVSGRWRQGLTPAEQGTSEVSGTVELSRHSVDAFGIGLPAGSVAGAGRGDFRLFLADGEAPRFVLTSDLSGLRLKLDAIGWSKSPGRRGRLLIEGRLGERPRVDRLEFSGGGLTASGRLDLGPGGAFRSATFSRVRIGRWLDAPVTLTSRGGNRAPAVRLGGGMYDMRLSTVGGSGGGSGGGHGPVEARLDRLIVSDSITLTDVRGRLDAGRSLNGEGTARVNGGTPIRAEITDGAVHVTSDNAGGAIRDAGLLENARGGSLDLVLKPAAAPETYDGTMKVRSTRVLDAPAMAELLNAMSLVGLLDQLAGGAGIGFDDVEASFRLTPKQVVLYSSSAIGASMGLSLDGVYDFDTGQMDMQGVISPFYFLNAIGSVLTRKGEGLIGISFTLKGAPSEPKVVVNPLSILTPGMFREIFRRPPPKRN